MPRRTFILSMAAGILLAVAVIASSSPGSGLGASYEYLFSAKGTQGAAHTTTGTMTASAVTSSANYVVTSTTMAVSPGSTGDSGGTQPSSPPQNAIQSLFSAVDSVAAASPSRLGNIPSQSPPLTGFVFIPVFVALLLGFALYRITRPRNEEESVPPQDTS